MKQAYLMYCTSDVNKYQIHSEHSGSLQFGCPTLSSPSFLNDDNQYFHHNKPL